MKRIKTTAIPSNLLFFDTETKGRINKEALNESHHYLWFGHALAFRLEKGVRTRQAYITFKKTALFWEFVRSRLDKCRPLYVFTHNLGFDLTIVDFWRRASTMGLEIEFAILEDPPTAIGAYWNECRIIFVDTLNYWRTKLADLGESLGRPKLVMPEYSAPFSEWEDYCKGDVDIIADAVERLLDYIKRNRLGTFSLTQASQAMSAFKHRFMSHPIYIHDRAKVLELERESYRGGLVHNYFVGLAKGRETFHLDINSLYPSVMLNPQPVKLVGQDRHISPKELAKRMKKHGACAMVRIETDDEPFPYYHEGKLYEAVGTFTTALAGPELSRALRTNSVDSVHFVSFYEMADIFSDYISFFYNERLRYKKAGDKVNDIFAKLMMNSLYGKFGQRGFQWVELNYQAIERIYHGLGFDVPKPYRRKQPEFDLNWRQHKWYPLGLDTAYTIRATKGLVQVQLPRGEHWESMPIIASYVTSYARERLRSLVRIAGQKQVLYTDTDSIFCTSKGYKRLVKAGEVDSTELGKLKLEGVSDYAEFRSPKNYIFGDKSKSKGIRDSAIAIGLDEFIQDQFEGLSSVLRREPKPYITIKWITKRNTNFFDKAIVNADGWTKYRRFDH